jgi:hypothetical protein
MECVNMAAAAIQARVEDDVLVHEMARTSR